MLTVVAGLFSPQDFPILEEKLAKLYRIAFLRQQAKHLGLNKGNQTSANQTEPDQQTIRRKRHASENLLISPTKTVNESQIVRKKKFEINRFVYERQVLRMKRQKVSVTKRDSPTPPPITQRLPYEILFNDSNRNKTRKFQKSGNNLLQKVQVMIHNLVHGDDDKDSVDTNKIDVSVDKNQTEIIYSVIVGGKPVLASTAAEDMRLVKLDEVIKIMENDIVLKAEREFF